MTSAKGKHGDKMLLKRKRKLKSEVGDKTLFKRKRKWTDPHYSIKSTREDPSTDSETSRSDLSRGSNFSASSTYDSYDDISTDIHPNGEYYCSSKSTRLENDTHPDYDYDESSLTYTARKRSSTISHDARKGQTGAGQRYPVFSVKTLGEGSFAVVHLCYSEADKLYFAVKRAKPSRRGALKSLTKEADVLKQLNSPYIIKYLGECRIPVTKKAGAKKPELLPMVAEIYLPYIKGGTLSDEIHGCLKKKMMMKENVIRDYTKQILSGLAYVHSKNIVHCDIKGSNILMGTPNLKISDFGVSKRVGNNSSENSRSLSRAGTKAWMAPEVLGRKEQGFPADVWSLGCTVVQMITGKPPVTQELKSFLSPETLTERMHSRVIPKVLKRLSFECIDFLKKCFIKDPRARGTCKQLLDHPFLN